MLARPARYEMMVYVCLFRQCSEGLICLMPGAGKSSWTVLDKGTLTSQVKVLEKSRNRVESGCTAMLQAVAVQSISKTYNVKTQIQ